MKAPIKSLKHHMGSRKQLRTEGQTLAERWPKLDKAGKRNIVEAVLDKVTVFPDEIAFEFNYVPGKLL